MYVVTYSNAGHTNRTKEVASEQEAIKLARAWGAVIRRKGPLLGYPHDMRERPTANEAVWIEQID